MGAGNTDLAEGSYTVWPLAPNTHNVCRWMNKSIESIALMAYCEKILCFMCVQHGGSITISDINQYKIISPY
jgi:hypothetical protein